MGEVMQITRKIKYKDLKEQIRREEIYTKLTNIFILHLLLERRQSE